ncbi:hypothetical protein PAXRUDRAFT_152171 [Paxillus rubicundulus Ve08.2h10]|uniref:Uncharacterized protein n=1 Tax=Paxillus rubicundulus Ve08.2h10 TaxID=930991 RepID=A0A0D0DQS0_9AGAM|nr:hypothetical protein PAXRUDRAFT_152171 [Paxillus rubicundulus Ve08.2h10]
MFQVQNGHRPTPHWIHMQCNRTTALTQNTLASAHCKHVMSYHKHKTPTHTSSICVANPTTTTQLPPSTILPSVHDSPNR